ncbi:PilZ domain-containing protein [Marinobacter pelagius]|uniref:PilZ domain-containing protein n=1 Tax=Marinobacter pelagius TaxID=379482 RepID=A0A366GMA3_9GAMM|nr:PilZ domain-containing protein [Marinobacter pelagius]RBP27151.1 PilZ domain-containing protein [Marinobacter pelagius]
MEHRLSKRVPGKLSILVYKRGMPVATGQVRNASRRGVFVSTDYDDVNLNQTLELELCYPEKTEKTLRRLKAHVVRKSAKGLGLDFDGADNDALGIAKLLSWLASHHATINYDSSPKYRTH